MTREEAIKLLEHINIAYTPTDAYGDYDDPQPYEEAIDMAIEALSEPNIVRCKDCKHSEGSEANKYFMTCKILDDMPTFVDSFCSYGEREK